MPTQWALDSDLITPKADNSKGFLRSQLQKELEGVPLTDSLRHTQQFSIWKASLSVLAWPELSLLSML